MCQLVHGEEILHFRCHMRTVRILKCHMSIYTYEDRAFK